MTSLALPRLDAVTPGFTLRSDTTFTGPLAQTLLRAGKIPSECANDDVPKSYRTVAERALQEIWTQAMRGLDLFAWRMYVSAPQTYSRYTPDDRCWFHIEPAGYCDDWPEVFIAPAIERLEAVKVGLGQTVLAVLYDALRYLPQVCTPQTALYLASYVHWYGAMDESEAVDMLLEHESPDRDQAMADYDIFTRRQFFASMPEWAATPRRQLTQAQVKRAARIDGFAGEVIRACDEIHRHVCAVSHFPDMSYGECECDAIGFCAFIRWNYNDPVLQLFDDYGNQAVQADYVEAATVVPISLAGNELSRWLDGLPHVGELARRVEALLALIAEQPEDRVTNRAQVRV